MLKNDKSPHFKELEIPTITSTILLSLNEYKKEIFFMHFNHSYTPKKKTFSVEKSQRTNIVAKLEEVR